MRLAWFALIAIAACTGSSGFDDDYPIRGGGGGGGGGGPGNRPDARLVDGGATMTGRVCVVLDLRKWTTGCAATGAEDLTVQIGTATAMTAANGSFEIVPPTGTGLTVRVEGATVVTSINPYDPTALVIQAVAPITAAWNALLSGSSISPTSGNGAAMAELLFDGNRAAGVIADSAPAPGAGAGGVFYDNPLDKDAWATDATHADSKALFADMVPGSAVVTANFMGSSNMGSVVIEAEAITFTHIDIPLP